MKRELLVIPSVGVVALAAAACGSTSSSNNGTSVAVGANTGSAGATTGQVSGQVQKGGILKALIEDDYDYWDNTSYYGAMWSISYITCNGLMDAPDSPDPVEQAKLIPGIAADMPKVSADGKTYTFTIRQGLKFSNGKPVTTADVKDTYLRNLDPKSGFNDGALGSGYYNVIQGFDAYQKGAKDISGITVKGQDVTFKLTKVDPTFPYATALRFMCIIPKGTPHKHTQLPPPLTGPYMVTAYTPKRSATIRRNPQWANNAKIMGLDQSKVNNIDGIDVSIGVPADQQVLKIQNNQADYSIDENAPAGSSVPEVARNPQLKDRFKVFDDAAISYVFMNTSIPPFNNVKLRQAVNYAANREALVTVRGGTLTGKAWSLPVAGPTLVGQSPQQPYPMGGDVSKAKQLIQQSGVKTPINVTMPYITRPDNDKIAQQFKNQMAQVGINVTLKPTPSSTYYQLVTDPKNKVQMGMAAWGQDYADPITFFGPLLSKAAAGGGSNYAQFTDPTINAQISKIDQMPLGNDRNKAWADLAVKVARDYAPWMVYVNRRQPELWSSRLHNFVWSPVAKQIYYGLLYIK